MKIIVLYLRIRQRVNTDLPIHTPYEVGEHRFLENYLRFKPAIPHQLVVVNCAPQPDNTPWHPCVSWITWSATRGSDCGTYQDVGRNLECDLVVCFNTLAYPWKPGWLERLAQVREKYGPGVYGPTSSFEKHPHLRTPCIATVPELLRGYPVLVDRRDAQVDLASGFEHGPDNFSLWAGRSGYPTLLVTWDGEYDPPNWRKPPNIFRRGDQSNCLIRDRHLDGYDRAGPGERRLLEKYADAKP